MPVKGICHAFQFVQSWCFLALAKFADYGLSSYYLLLSSEFIGGMAIPLQARFRYYFRLAVLSSHEAIRG